MGVVSLGVNKVHVGTFVLSLTFSSILSPLFCPVLMSAAVCACVSSRSQTTLCLPALGEKPCTNETPPRRHCVSSGDIVLTQTGLSRRSFLSFWPALECLVELVDQGPSRGRQKINNLQLFASAIISFFFLASLHSIF